jgi:hypothetical protein
MENKLKIKTVKRIVPAGIDLRALGEEHKWDDTQTTMTNQQMKEQMMRCFNFYTNQCSDKETRSFIEVYLSHNNMTKELAAFNKVSDNLIVGPMPWLCRMSMMGLNLSNIHKQYIIDELNRISELSQLKESKKKPKPVFDIQQKVTEAINETIGDIDFNIDEFIRTRCKHKFDCYAWLKEYDLKPMYASRIVQIYTEELKEIKELMKGEDEQLVEAYGFLTKREIKKLHDFVQKIIDDAKTWSTNQKKARAPRKIKKKSADQVTRNVKYQKADSELRLTSIDPSKMVNASEVWVFNSKTRCLARYVADSGGLSVTGTSLKNFSEVNSLSKKIRKPEDLAKSVVTGGIKSVAKYFDNLTTKATSANGRLNETSLILRIA